MTAGSSAPAAAGARPFALLPSGVRRTNLVEEFLRAPAPWVSRPIGQFNGQVVKVITLDGDRCGWHVHEDADELFWVVAGLVELCFRDGSVVLAPGELAVAPAGMAHRVVPLEPARLVVMQPPASVARPA
ncbi:MAG TPA: cupin domain-containing protein [Gemmatimonadaceae bacterium]|nr:cupin domain-containing protein [Gemmatimonadaceae bacterium]